MESPKLCRTNRFHDVRAATRFRIDGVRKPADEVA